MFEALCGPHFFELQGILDFPCLAIKGKIQSVLVFFGLRTRALGEFATIII